MQVRLSDSIVPFFAAFCFPCSASVSYTHLFVAVAVAATVDMATGLEGHPLRAAACLFYIGNEGISIVENLGRAGVPIPMRLAALFQRLKEENDKG